jgi:hypothetical protein
MAFDFSNVKFLPDTSGNSFNDLEQYSIVSNMQLAYRFSDTARQMFDKEMRVLVPIHSSILRKFSLMATF